MIGILTWPTYGTWFAHRGRGWVDRHEPGSRSGLPEPRRRSKVPAGGRWSPVRLDASLRRALLADLRRIAELRRFGFLMAVAAEDHVHVLLACERGREVPALVQLVKGAASRALSRAAGPAGQRSESGEPLPHRKWWSRQYAFRAIRDPGDLEQTVAQLAAHSPDRTTRFRIGSPISFTGDDAFAEPAS